MTDLVCPQFIPIPHIWQPTTVRCAIPEAWDFVWFKTLAETDPSLPCEGYRLLLTPEKLQMQVGGPRALAYAWQHFQQWRATGPLVPCGVLEDAPCMERRGFMLDISRCKVPSREGLEEWVKLLAAFRYNELQLYTEHTFAYKNHRSVWENSSPLDAEDVRWLQDLCKQQGIELVPNQNGFGHFERWIKHDAYRKYAESPDGFVTPWGDRRKMGSVLKPDAASLTLVKELLDEMLPLFESEWVNIGCDETFELGQGFSKARCKAEGSGKVYTDFVRQIMTHVSEKHGKRCQFWGDILLKTPEQLKNLPSDVLALEWGYEADHPFTEDSRRFSESGLDFMICPGTSSWRAFAGRSETMLENIRRGAEAAKTNDALGMLLTDWGDNGHLQQNPVSYPALAWCGLNAWNPDTARVEDAEAWGDEIAFEGHAGDTACWLQAGRVHELLERKCANTTSIFQLFCTPQQTAAEIQTDNLRRCLDSLGNLIPPACFRDEWEQSLRNMRLSLSTALKIKGEDPGDLKPLLAEAQAAHQELWLRRNRQGGLAESLSMYTEVANHINAGENDD